MTALAHLYKHTYNTFCWTPLALPFGAFLFILASSSLRLLVFVCAAFAALPALVFAYHRAQIYCGVITRCNEHGTGGSRINQ